VMSSQTCILQVYKIRTLLVGLIGLVRAVRLFPFAINQIHSVATAGPVAIELSPSKPEGIFRASTCGKTLFSTRNRGLQATSPVCSYEGVTGYAVWNLNTNCLI